MATIKDRNWKETAKGVAMFVFLAVLFFGTIAGIFWQKPFGFG